MITTLAAHLIGAFAVAFSAIDIAAAIPAGLMFAVLGAFYIIVEAPLVFGGQIILDHLPSRQSLILTGVTFPIAGAAFGYFICFKEGGSRPPDYALGFAIAGGLAGLLTILSVLMWPKGNMIGEQDGSYDGG